MNSITIDCTEDCYDLSIVNDMHTFDIGENDNIRVGKFVLTGKDLEQCLRYLYEQAKQHNPEDFI